MRCQADESAVAPVSKTKALNEQAFIGYAKREDRHVSFESRLPVRAALRSASRHPPTKGKGSE